jgi:hypothetical protein
MVDHDEPCRLASINENDRGRIRFFSSASMPTRICPPLPKTDDQPGGSPQNTEISQVEAQGNELKRFSPRLNARVSEVNKLLDLSLPCQLSSF